MRHKRHFTIVFCYAEPRNHEITDRAMYSLYMHIKNQSKNIRISYYNSRFL